MRQMIGHFHDAESVMSNNSIWGGFSFLVGFLVVFRTSQAYSRFWDGGTLTHQMMGDWFDAVSSLVAFCTGSKAGEDKVTNFKHILLRLFSLLHAFGILRHRGESWCTSNHVPQLSLA